MKKIYAVFEGSKIIKMSENEQECINYRNSFPPDVRKNMLLSEKFIAGEKEYQQSHWMFEQNEETNSE